MPSKSNSPIIQRPDHLLIDNHSPRLDIILPGASQGIISAFIKKTIQRCQELDHNILALNFPFHQRGEDHSSGPQLKEERKHLEVMLEQAHKELKFKKITVIAKSLGGIIIAKYLEKNRIPELDKIIILGMVVGQVDLNNFSGQVIVIQGEKDRFGNGKKVKDALSNCRHLQVHEIKGASHSFKNPQTNQPEFYQQAISFID